jgi:hypothetical protein
MNLIDPQIQAALEAALFRVQQTSDAVATRAVELLGAASASATRISERDSLNTAQFELRRGQAIFQAAFRQALRERVMQEVAPSTETGRRSLDSTASWQSLSLVDDRQVEEQMLFDRMGQMISHQCEPELRELAGYMGSLLGLGRPDEERNPLRGEVVGTALYRAIEAVTAENAIRKLLAGDLGQAMAKAMPECYRNIIGELQIRGVQPVSLAVRMFEGPGSQLPGLNSGYASLRREDGGPVTGHSEWQGGGATTHGGMPGATRMGGHGGAPSGYHPSGASARGGAVPRGQQGSFAGANTRMGGVGAAGGGPTHRGNSSAVDGQLMDLLRRLTYLASQPGNLDTGVGPMYSPEGGAAQSHMMGMGAAQNHETLSPPAPGQLMAVNLIRAHRGELMQASSGQLDQLVIEVVSSLFDQILSDSRVPPQMVRQIARLQLPVLRVALHDPGFFSSRKHPVRRFVNRIASLACAYDDFTEGTAKQLLQRVKELIQEIVDGDFDQIQLYAAKLTELEQFVAQQSHAEIRAEGTAATLENKESELRIQQQYMLQLQSALSGLNLADYMREFLAQVWSQALVSVSRRDGVDSERHKRYKQMACELVMSVQPKGAPQHRQKFLLQLPQLMKSLNEGMALVGWPDAAQKDFFGKLLPAHAEALKGKPLSELDHNLFLKQLEAIFAAPMPTGDASWVPPPHAVEAAAQQAPVEQHFTPEEAQKIGLIVESAVDWSGEVDIDLDATGPAVAAMDTQNDQPPYLDTAAGGTPQSTSGVDLDLDINLELNPNEPAEPSRGAQLMDHIKLGFAYQMHLKEEWHKVRLTYVSPARSFFVFKSGKNYQETISMTSRMVARMCETNRMRAYESASLVERATQRARKQLAALKTSGSSKAKA